MRNLDQILAEFRTLPANKFPEARDRSNQFNLRQQFENWLDATSEPLESETLEKLEHLESLIYLDDFPRQFKFAELVGLDDVYRRIRLYLEQTAATDQISRETELIVKSPQEQWAYFVEAQKMHINFQSPEDDGTDKTLRLLQLAGYLDFAEKIFRDALNYIRKIQNGSVPYAADKAWPLEDGHLLGRIARIGLSCDATWCREALPELLLGACVSPLDKAKTAPSQAATIQIGHAIAAHPRRWAIVALGEAQTAARHAGLKKKLRNNLKAAETALISDPAFFHDLPVDEPLPKRLKTTLIKAVERLLMDSKPIPNFPKSFFAHKDLRPIAGTLIWRVKRSVAVFDAIPTDLAWLLSDGSHIEMLDNDCAYLWHPIEAKAQDIEAWEMRCTEAKLTQPFAQIHREQYEIKPEEVIETLVFADHEIGSSPFLAVSKGLGWATVGGAIRFSLNGYTFSFQTDAEQLYPGATFTTRGVKLLAGANKLSEVEPRLLSEILRQVDLFTSLGIEAAYRTRFSEQFSGMYMKFLDDPDPFRPGQKSLRARKHAIQTLFRPAVEEGALKLHPRSVSFGDYNLHLGTMRLTHKGKQVAVPETAKVDFLPFQDEALKRAVKIISAGLRAL